MIRLKTKLSLFNLFSKLFFAGLFLLLLPYIVERINTLQTDKELIQKREVVLDLITEIGIDPFIIPDSRDDFGSYNILKEEFISLERIQLTEDQNYIDISRRLIEDKTIDYRVLHYSFKVDGETYLLEIGKSLKSIGYAEINTRKVMLIFLAFFIFITLLTDFIYTERILRPLKFITGKLRATSTPSLIDRTAVKTTTKDFFRLDQTIRELMDKTEELFQKEKEITVNISHELMTPLSVLRSKLENLLLQKELDDDTSQKIEESLRTLHRLKSLVNSLLLIARIESRQYLKEDSFRIKEILKEILEEIHPMAADAGITITEEFREELSLEKANRSLVFSMIFNVVNNALKNTPEGGQVSIHTGYHQERFQIVISDNGRGMTEEQLNRLFSRFKTRLDTDKNSTGIGLAITKSIADFHNIGVSVESEPGKGTRFTFCFYIRIFILFLKRLDIYGNRE